jgi:hypothetical protein
MIVPKKTIQNILSWVFEFESCFLKKVKTNHSKIGKKAEKFISSLKSIVGEVNHIANWDGMEFDEMHVSKKYTIKRGLLHDMRRQSMNQMPDPWLLHLWDTATMFRNVKCSEELSMELSDMIRSCIETYIEDVYKQQSTLNRL